jgi:hypothetical protein
MPPTKFKVVPFLGQIKTGFFSADNANTVSRQLEGQIQEHAASGWDFVCLAKADIEVRPGCLSSLFGAKTSYITFDQLVFKRD